MRGLGLCRVLIDLGWEQPWSDRHAVIAQDSKETAARRIIFRQDEIMDNVPVICEGWAASILQLSDGRRQILSLLLPGEMITAGLLFEEKLHCSIDGITRCCYRSFDRSQLRDAIFASPKIFDRILSAYNEEKNRADRLITDLGRRTAPERVARLVLDIWDRLDKASMVEGDRIEFPLRQTHIADATGLTPVYVNKVLSEFRRDGLVTIAGRWLQLTDKDRLRRLAA